MIKFFRKIRYDLLERNKTGKYLKYTIGEIVLVVIGILIALQINNWNENRKVQKQETQIYKELHSDLLQTKNDILALISKNKDNINSTTQLLNAITNKKTYNDSLYNFFTSIGADNKIFLKTSAFENLKNIGLNTLSSDSLRIAITSLYQIDLERLITKPGKESSEMAEKLFPYQLKYLYVDLEDPMMYRLSDSISLPLYMTKIKNYDQFLKDNELLLVIQASLYNRSHFVIGELQAVEAIEKVMEEIEKELNPRSRKIASRGGMH